MKLIFTDNSLRSLINFREDCLVALNKLGHTIIAITPEGEDYELSQKFDFIKIYRVPVATQSTNPISDFKYLLSLRKIYKKEKPDYIFHFTIKPNIYGSLAAKSLKLRSSSMIAGLGYAFSSSSFKQKLIQKLYKFALKYSENVLVLNVSNRDLLINKKIVNPSKLILLKGGEGVNLDKFTELPMSQNDKPVFLMIARVLYDKGYSEFVAAAKKYHDVAEFRLIGGIDYNPTAVPESVIRQDDADGYINYVGFTNDVLSHLKQSDCIVLPSYYFEGLSRSLMEGLACGRPLITTDFPGCRETVDDGVNGFLTTIKSEQSLIDAVRRFIDLPLSIRAEMGKASRQKAEREFDIKNVIDVYVNILDN